MEKILQAQGLSLGHIYTYIIFLGIIRIQFKINNSNYTLVCYQSFLYYLKRQHLIMHKMCLIFLSIE